MTTQTRPRSLSPLNWFTFSPTICTGCSRIPVSAPALPPPIPNPPPPSRPLESAPPPNAPVRSTGYHLTREHHAILIERHFSGPNTIPSSPLIRPTRPTETAIPGLSPSVAPRTTLSDLLIFCYLSTTPVFVIGHVIYFSLRPLPPSSLSGPPQGSVHSYPLTGAFFSGFLSGYLIISIPTSRPLSFVTCHPPLWFPQQNPRTMYILPGLELFRLHPPIPCSSSTTPTPTPGHNFFVSDHLPSSGWSPRAYLLPGRPPDPNSHHLVDWLPANRLLACRTGPSCLSPFKPHAFARLKSILASTVERMVTLSADTNDVDSNLTPSIARPPPASQTTRITSPPSPNRSLQ